MVVFVTAVKCGLRNRSATFLMLTLAEGIKGFMMSKMTLIIRPQPDADRDVALLTRYGVPALASPSMKCKFQRLVLPELVNFSGIVFTSRNAVEAIIKLSKVNRDMRMWAELPVFAVGSATAAAARSAGFSKIFTSTDGGAGLLAPISSYFFGKTGMQEHEQLSNLNLPLFWPSALEISFDMVSVLAKQGFAVQRLPVYQMIANEPMDPSITKKIEQGAIVAVVALSPRSAQIFRNNLAAAGKASCVKRISLIAGSAKIAEAAGNGWQEIYIARHPRRSRLLAIAIMRHRQKH